MAPRASAPPKSLNSWAKAVGWEAEAYEGGVGVQTLPQSLSSAHFILAVVAIPPSAVPLFGVFITFYRILPLPTPPVKCFPAGMVMNSSTDQNAIL